MPAQQSLTTRIVRARSFWRAAFVLCLIAGFLGIQLASESHPHDDAGGHCCPVCHAGHTPILKIGVNVRIQPQSLVVWQVYQEDFAAARSHSLTLQLSRAPPA